MSLVKCGWASAGRAWCVWSTAATTRATRSPKSYDLRPRCARLPATSASWPTMNSSRGGSTRCPITIGSRGTISSDRSRRMSGHSGSSSRACRARNTLMVQLAAVGVTVCDPQDKPVLQIRKPLPGDRFGHEALEMKALIEGLHASIKMIDVFTNFKPLYNHGLLFFLCALCLPVSSRFALESSRCMVCMQTL